MKLWLDDVRDPAQFGHIGWVWVKTAQEAIDALKTGTVEKASLDHDLSPDHYPWSGVPLEQCVGTGYDVVCWMDKNNVYPPGGVTVHSMNPVGKERMERVLQNIRMYKRRFENWENNHEQNTN